MIKNITRIDKMRKTAGRARQRELGISPRRPRQRRGSRPASPSSTTAHPRPSSQVAAIASPDPRTLVIQPWDGSVLKAIEKAIQVSDLGINPQNDGKSHPPELPAADRGAPQGACQGHVFQDR